METDENVIDRCCNNDALGLIFEFVGGFDFLATIPFVCKRWRKVAKNAPLTFDNIRGWAFALPDPILEGGEISVCILASTENKEYIPYRDLHQNHSGLHKLIKSIFWYSTSYSQTGQDNCYILGTMKFSDDTPMFYFALEQCAATGREIVIHSDLFELLSYGTTVRFKQEMKEKYFDKQQKRRIDEYKRHTRRRRKKYR
jgi:hypothetical protein